LAQRDQLFIPPIHFTHQGTQQNQDRTNQGNNNSPNLDRSPLVTITSESTPHQFNQSSSSIKVPDTPESPSNTSPAQNSPITHNILFWPSLPLVLPEAQEIICQAFASSTIKTYLAVLKPFSQFWDSQNILITDATNVYFVNYAQHYTSASYSFSVI
jgi:hypothetical protein